MALLVALVLVAIVLCATMTFAWAFAIRTGQSGWVDTIWSLTVGVVGFAAALAPIDAAGWSSGPSLRQWLVAGCCGLWGMRLGLHIGARTRGGGDDPRYAKLKAEWGDNYVRQFFIFLQIQALAALVLDAACLVAAHAPGSMGIADATGLIVLVAAIAGEAVADRQLAWFKRQAGAHGRVCDIGLWSWSRHPNYFFEWLGWCAYPIIAIAHVTDYAIGGIALAAPIMMYWLLVHVSGIPPLEAHMMRSRGGAFSAYQARVKAFWPWPPKS